MTDLRLHSESNMAAAYPFALMVLARILAGVSGRELRELSHGSTPCPPWSDLPHIRRGKDSCSFGRTCDLKPWTTSRNFPSRRDGRACGPGVRFSPSLA
jgi:hypothetical protein